MKNPHRAATNPIIGANNVKISPNKNGEPNIPNVLSHPSALASVVLNNGITFDNNDLPVA